MTYEIYRYIFFGGAILSGIMIIVTVLVFFVLKIPTVIGDLTGANARKAIENIRNQNENSGDKLYKSSPINSSRGKLTDKISQSGKIKQIYSSGVHGAMPTAKISTKQLMENLPANETTLLSEETSNNCETTVLNFVEQESYSSEFVIEYEITFIHTDEIIA